MLINPISLIVGMSGKLSKKEDVVFSVRYDNVHAWRSTAYRGPFTPDQTEVQADFAEASRQASADMADSVKKAEWLAIAKASKGRWKTARGAAFASYYKQNQQQ